MQPLITDLRLQLSSRFQRPLMTFFLRRCHDHEEAKDLTQEVLLRVVRAIGSERTERIERAESFVFKVAINLLRDRRRRVERDGNPGFVPIEDIEEGEGEWRLAEEMSPERVISSRESLADALRALEELGTRTRDIFILFRLENMKQKDIAALYGIGQSTVEKHVMKATLHLAIRYGRR
ncbi:RNA polymerase sigma factor [Peristeroidobacter soli]|uniref:RNA polymerase sigma factor n=1 Tax=Peristeroidobacter soli TaxID=2497877 RepID=UPI0024824382|nr:sigma-70 family RNA polymerase sigma factor [Peristeroidobacter soli]